MMSIATRFRLLGLLLLTPGLALAQSACRFEQSQELGLDLAGVRTLAIELGRHSLHLDAASDGDGIVQIRACASSQARLDALSLVQQRDDTRLHLQARDDGGSNVFGLFGGSDYAYQQLALRIPRNIAVTLSIGSGDAQVAAVAALDAEIGSGDLTARTISGPVSVRIGSGDVVLTSVGGLSVPSLGSGDLLAKGIGGDLNIGEVGSGDLEASDIAGSVRLDALNSGDVALRAINGSVQIGSIGSGDLTIARVGGSISVDRLGSGDIDVRDVRGDVRVASKGSGDVDTADVDGEVLIENDRR